MMFLRQNLTQSSKKPWDLILFAMVIGFLVFAVANGWYWPVITAACIGIYFLLYSLKIRTASLTGWLGAPAKFLFLCIGLMAFLLREAAAHQGISTPQILAVLIFMECAYPLWRYLHGKDQGIPWVAFIVFAYGVYYGLPLLLPFPTNPNFLALTQESRIHAQALTLFGISILLLTFYFWPRKTWRIVPQLSSEWSEPKAKRFALLFAFFGLVSTVSIQIFTVPLQWQEPLNYIAQMSLLAIAMLVLFHLQNRLMLRLRLILLLLVAAQILLGMATGAVAPVIRLGGILMILYTFYKRDVPLKWGLLILPFLVLLLATKTEFRGLVGSSEELSGNPIKRAFAFAKISYTFLTQTTPEERNLGYTTVAWRFDTLSVFSDVVNKTPYEVPYWGGYTFKSLVWKFIPRAIYPDKPPGEQLGQEFGHRYGLVNPTDFTTAENLPLLVEMYANFGVAGVIFGMFLLGLLYQLLDHVLNHEKAGEWGIIAGTVILGALMTIENNFSLTYGSIVNLTVFLFLLGKLVQKPHPRSQTV